jgi:hypothetical protein
LIVPIGLLLVILLFHPSQRQVTCGAAINSHLHGTQPAVTVSRDCEPIERRLNCRAPCHRVQVSKMDTSIDVISKTARLCVCGVSKIWIGRSLHKDLVPTFLQFLQAEAAYMRRRTETTKARVRKRFVFFLFNVENDHSRSGKAASKILSSRASLPFKHRPT